MRPQPITATELQRRLNAHECIRCLVPMTDLTDGRTKPVDIDPKTGFPFQHCISCRGWLARQPTDTKGGAQWKRDHKAEGLDNLDRLTGQTTKGD